MAQTRQLVLASTSRYRQELLKRLGLDFQCMAPGTQETPLPGESASGTALRLAELKARAVAGDFPDALIVGSDQVAALGRERLDKPGTHENAKRQLEAASGKAVDFQTAVCVFDARTGVARCSVVACRVLFRPLTAAQIEIYLRRERPYDCAASAKSEALGIALIARIETDDPTSLIGLPLIALTDLLAEAGLPVLA